MKTSNVAILLINWFLIIGVLIYNIIGILYAFSLRYGLLSIINSIWQGVSLLFTVLLGIFYFNERPNIKQMICILFVFIGTIGLIFIK
jgi:small multidrug resistance pump